MAVTLGTLALIFGTAPLNQEGQPQLSGAAGPIALVAANLYLFAFGMSWGPVVWVMLGEKFSNRIRAAALGVAAAAQWIANWLISTTFPALSDVGLGLATASTPPPPSCRSSSSFGLCPRPRARNWRKMRV